MMISQNLTFVFMITVASICLFQCDAVRDTASINCSSIGSTATMTTMASSAFITSRSSKSLPRVVDSEKQMQHVKKHTSANFESSPLRIEHLLPSTTNPTSTTKLGMVFGGGGGGSKKTKKGVANAKSSKTKKSAASSLSELDGGALLLTYMTPWRNPNSIFVYMLLTVYCLGKYSESKSIATAAAAAAASSVDFFLS